MHAIDGPGSIAGKFTAGNPAIGQDATAVTADWLNDIQENVLAVLVEGKVEPAKGRSADLLDALKVIIKGVQGGDQQGVPTTRKLSGAGLATVDGDGDLSADRVITVRRASAEQILAGESDNTAITPLALMQALLTGGGPGSVDLFGALTIKVGSMIGNYREGPVYTPFPKPFAEACWVAVPIIRNDTGGNRRDFSPHLVGPPSKEGFTAMLQLGGGETVNSIDGFMWVALGR